MPVIDGARALSPRLLWVSILLLMATTVRAERLLNSYTTTRSTLTTRPPSLLSGLQDRRRIAAARGADRGLLLTIDTKNR
jgi:hypothetical protein